MCRTQGEAIHDEYQEARRAVDRALKQHERGRKQEIRAEHGAVVPLDDIREQLVGNKEPVNASTVVPTSFQILSRDLASRGYSRILLMKSSIDIDLSRQVTIVYNLIFLL